MRYYTRKKEDFKWTYLTEYIIIFLIAFKLIFLRIIISKIILPGQLLHVKNVCKTSKIPTDLHQTLTKAKLYF